MPIDASDFASGRLVSELTTATTTGVQVQMDRINKAYRTMPTGSFYLYLRRKSDTDTYTEKVLVASGTTNNSTTGIATLGTLTRNISLTSGTDTTGTTATYTWPSGTLVYQGIGAEVVERVALLNEANSFSQELDVTGNNNYVGLPSMTTANAPAYAAGRMYFDTTDNLPKIGVGGSFTNMTSGSVADASTTVAGKVEEATLAEISAGTAAGGTGARLFVNPTHVKKNSTGAAEGNIVALNSSVQLDSTLLPNIPVTKLNSGTSASSNTFWRGDETWAATTKTHNEVLTSATSSTAVGDSSTAENDIDTYQYTIPANDLVSGVRYTIELFGDLTYAGATNDPVFRMKLGSTTIAATTFTDVGTASIYIRAHVVGTASAGASVSVRGGIFASLGEGTAGKVGTATGSASVATNGTLLLKITQQNNFYGTPMNIVIKSGAITKESSTAF